MINKYQKENYTLNTSYFTCLKYVNDPKLFTCEHVGSRDDCVSCNGSEVFQGSTRQDQLRTRVDGKFSIDDKTIYKKSEIHEKKKKIDIHQKETRS